MTRFPRFAGLLAAVLVLLIGPLASAQYAQVGGQPTKGVQPQFPALPGFWQLRMESVQKDLELVPEQIDKLKQLGKKYYEDMRAQHADYKDWGKMTQEERTARYKELSEKRKQQTEALRKEVEKILLPHQLEALRKINFRQMGPSMLYQPKVMETVGITDDQKAKIQKIRQELTEKYRQLQKESFDQILKVLTPEQQKKLEEQVQAGRRY